MKTGWAVAYGVLCGLLAAGILFLASRPVRGEPIELRPMPSPSPLKVHVTGQVKMPGLYLLPPGSRVLDAINSAGGFNELANSQAINLAAKVEDGQKILVPVRGPVVGPVEEAAEGPAGQVVYPLDINLASQSDLESLPGIGPATAQAILQYRSENGAFQAVEELDNVPGIGPVTMEKIKDLVTVNP